MPRNNSGPTINSISTVYQKVDLEPHNLSASVLELVSLIILGIKNQCWPSQIVVFDQINSDYTLGPSNLLNFDNTSKILEKIYCLFKNELI